MRECCNVSASSANAGIVNDAKSIDRQRTSAKIFFVQLIVVFIDFILSHTVNLFEYLNALTMAITLLISFHSSSFAKYRYSASGSEWGMTGVRST